MCRAPRTSRDQARLPSPAREAAPRRLRRAGREGALRGGRRGVRGALEARDARGLRPLRPRRPAERRRTRPSHFDFGNLADVFSAFFGDDLLGGTRSRPRWRRARPRRDRLREAATGVRRSVPFPSPSRARAATATVPSPARRQQLPDVRRRRPRQPGVAHRLRRVRPLAACPTCAGSGRVIETPCQRVRAATAGSSRSARSTWTSRRESTTGSASACPGRATWPGRRAAGRRLCRRHRAARSGLRPPGRRHVHDGGAHDHRCSARRDRHGADARRRDRARVRAGHAAGRGPHAARQGHAGAAAASAAATSTCSSPSSSRADSRRSSAPAEQLRRVGGAETYDADDDEGFFHKLKSALPLRPSLGRASIPVPLEEAEAAVARFLELVPDGHEVDAGTTGLELAVYIDGAAARRRSAPRSRRSRSNRSTRAGRTPGALPPGVPHRPALGRPAVGAGPAEGALAIVIDPGRAFGTGSHPTTRLALELLVELAARAACSTSAAARACSLSLRQSSASRRCSRATTTRSPSRSRARTRRETASTSTRRVLDARHGRPASRRRRRREHRARRRRGTAPRECDCRRLVLSGYLAAELPVASRARARRAARARPAGRPSRTRRE